MRYSDQDSGKCDGELNIVNARINKIRIKNDDVRLIGFELMSQG